MRRLSLWIRAHPMVGDSVLALLLFGFDAFAVGAAAATATVGWVFVAVGLVLAAPLAIRRRAPLLCAYLVLAGGFLQLFTQGGGQAPGAAGLLVRPADIALGLTLYTLVAYVGRRHAGIYAVWLLIGTVAWAAWRVGPNAGPVLGPVMLLVFAFFWILGEYLGARRAYQSEVERRVELLETERDQQARIAVADERARIARELHDVVAHAVSVIVVQADGAAYAIRTDPDLAESAVQTISDTGRSALSELRRLLGVLRSESQDGELVPQPDAGGLSTLADRIGDIGLPVRLRLDGNVDGLPSGVGLNLYRIIQEALTNTLKHGGEGATAEVTVARDDESVSVCIDDDGSGTGTDLREVSGGNGLIGMRERAAVHGGTVQAGPRPEGGWRVRAELPVAPQ